MPALVCSLIWRHSHGNTDTVLSFPGGYCQSCNDVDLHKAELRYRFVALLAQDDLTVPIIVADEEAAAFLPPLPPMSTSTNPNDRGKTLQQIREASAQTLDILLGAKIDGVRPRPVIDLSVEMYEVRQKEKGVVVLRVFGMKSL